MRRFSVNDAQEMFDNWESDERVTRFLSWEPHESPDMTRRMLENWCAAYEKPDTYKWAIESEGEVIGNISVVSIEESCEVANLGYCIGFDYWNRGFMTEAASAVIDFLFGSVGFHRIGISHAVKNPASGKVAVKCGFTYEGTAREYYKCASGEHLDVAYYGILRSEWEKHLADN